MFARFCTALYCMLPGPRNTSGLVTQAAHMLRLRQLPRCCWHGIGEALQVSSTAFGCIVLGADVAASPTVDPLCAQREAVHILDACVGHVWLGELGPVNVELWEAFVVRRCSQTGEAMTADLLRTLSPLMRLGSPLARRLLRPSAPRRASFLVNDQLKPVSIPKTDSVVKTWWVELSRCLGMNSMNL